jgi:hypothetical protein
MNQVRAQLLIHGGRVVARDWTLERNATGGCRLTLNTAPLTARTYGSIMCSLILGRAEFPIVFDATIHGRGVHYDGTAWVEEMTTDSGPPETQRLVFCWQLPIGEPR